MNFEPLDYESTNITISLRSLSEFKVTVKDINPVSIYIKLCFFLAKTISFEHVIRISIHITVVHCTKLNDNPILCQILNRHNGIFTGVSALWDRVLSPWNEIKKKRKKKCFLDCIILRRSIMAGVTLFIGRFLYSAFWSRKFFLFTRSMSSIVCFIVQQRS